MTSESGSTSSKLAIAAVMVLLMPFLAAAGVAMAATGSGAASSGGGMSLECILSGDPAIKKLLTEEQWGNAAAIHTVAAGRQLSERASIIAIATALQESTLHNYGDLGEANDHDSLGLFQQRPSQGWGEPEQIMDPAYATGKFLDKLVTINGWETMPVTEAAQAVQNSAYPDAYAKHEPLATQVVRIMTGNTACTGSLESDNSWVAPVSEPIVSGYRSGERPDHDGVDFGSPRGTTIKAVGAGIVKTVLCNASTSGGAAYSCDIDGSPSIQGCGWYVEILHTDDTVTRYCHMLKKPAVAIGDKVKTGQTIGVVGTSGNSSGPHLHFESHGSFPAGPENAVDPLSYMDRRGVKIH